MAATRVRKAFRYPSESDFNNEPDEIDEEHQERLIAELQAQDVQKNDLYRNVFVCVPLLGASFFLYTFAVALTARQRLMALLSLSSLLSTAYILHFMPIEAPDRKGKRSMYRIEADNGPVRKYLVTSNAALAGLLFIAAALDWRKGVGEDTWRETLPTIIFGITMFVRQQLAPLDLEELQKARYEYKGA